MIRKVVILLLSLVSGTVAVVAVVSYWTGFGWTDGRCPYAPRAWESPHHWACPGPGFSFSHGTACVTLGSCPNDPKCKHRFKRFMSGTEVFGKFAGVSLLADSAACSICVPLVYPLVLTGGYPSLVLLRGPLRRWRRRHKGLCVKCGYDLTGNLSGVCPECGGELGEGRAEQGARCRSG